MSNTNSALRHLELPGVTVAGSRGRLPESALRDFRQTGRISRPRFRVTSGRSSGTSCSLVTAWERPSLFREKGACVIYLCDSLWHFPAYGMLCEANCNGGVGDATFGPGTQQALNYSSWGVKSTQPSNTACIQAPLNGKHGSGMHVDSRSPYVKPALIVCVLRAFAVWSDEV